MQETVFRLVMPEALVSSTVFSSPHSGAEYPEAFLARSRLDPLQIRSSEDAFVDELFSAAPASGAPLIAARVPRACVDLNRAAEELDPALIEGAVRRSTSPRIVAGLGVIPRVVAEGRPICDGKLTLAEAQARLVRYYHPYHDALKQLLADAHRRFGHAILLDCHSMPHDALASAPGLWGKRPDIVLGDRFGAACDRWVIDAATQVFRAQGFVVARNAPFAGGFITQSYGRPRHGIHALQIEIDRSLYMDEARVARLPEFASIQALIAAAVEELAQLGRRALPLAAE